MESAAIRDPKMSAWHGVVISWINVLNLLPSDVRDFKEILGTQFFHNFLHEICGEADSADSSAPQNERIIKFVKREYPQFEVDREALECDGEELALLLSLLLFHSVVKGIEVARKNMCKIFDEETQVLVQIFVEKLFPLTGLLTKGNVSWALRAVENSGLKDVETPTCFSTTPKSNRTLKTFLQSPATFQQKVINEKCQEIRQLKLKLGSEQCEKNHLVDELARADEKFKHLSDKYEKKQEEVRKLMSERMFKDEEGQKDFLLQGPSVAKEQKCSAIVGKLKNKIDELEEGTCTLNQQNDGLRKQVKAQSENIVTLKSTVEEYLTDCELLRDELVIKNNLLDSLTERCKDLEKFVEEAKSSESNPRHNLSALSFTGEAEDLGRAVTDLKLCQEIEKNRVLTEKVEQLQVSLQEMETVRAQNFALLEEKEKLRERFKAEYSSVRKELQRREAQLNEARDTFRNLREQFEAELLRKIEVVSDEYKAKVDALKVTMKEAYNAEVAKLKLSEGELKSLRDQLCKSQAFAEELKAKYRQLAVEKQALQDQLLRIKGREDCRDLVMQRRVQTSGVGKMFHEEEEEFNNTYLADMCLPEREEDRLAELRYRNSLCLPHLKSSYPGETQFHDPSRVKDEDIKMGFPPPPEEQTRRKDRGHKKPAPPTPGKKGRSVGDEATPRRTLNDASGRFTPSRLKALFPLGRASRRDENAPTPRTKALGLFRKPHKRF